jgi:3-hydroxymyristoyl/3-hydroxydecanoyl-(acyl carrier protein) dehydratase
MSIQMTRVPVRPVEPVFSGHYPGFPVLPGVCVIEWVHRAARAALPGEPVLVEVEQARFLGPVFPGDELTVELTRSPDGERWRCAADVSTAAGRVARVRLSYGASRSLPADGSASPPGGGHTFGADRITQLIPHRDPMLLLDRVHDLVPGNSITATRTLRGDEPGCGGAPLDPHVLAIESWCQAAGALAVWARPNPSVLSGRVLLLGTMTGVRLAGSLRPGDVIEHRVRFAADLGDTAVFAGGAVAGGRPVLSVRRLVVTTRPATELCATALGGSPR